MSVRPNATDLAAAIAWAHERWGRRVDGWQHFGLLADAAELTAQAERERDALRTQLSTAQADAQRLREALRPFADRARSFAENRRNSFDYSDAFGVYVSLGDLRAARAALEARGEDTK